MRLYSAGVKNRVNKANTDKPPTTTRPSGAQISEPSPSPMVMGIKASVVVSVVIIIGRSQVTAPRKVASMTPSPCRRSGLL